MSWSIRPVDLARDRAEIRALIKACYGNEGVSPEAFEHWHFGHQGMSQGMMVAVDGERVVGMQPMELLPHYLAGRETLAGMFTGVMVDPDYRRQGIFLALIKACEELAWEREAALVWTMPNERSRPGFIKAGYEEPGERSLHIWSRKPASLLAGKLPAPLAAMAALPLKLLLGARRPVGDWPVNVCDTLAMPAQERAALAEGSAWRGIVQKRDLNWLRWRFGGPDAGEYVYWTTGRGEARAAWAVGRMEEREGLSAGYLVDLAGDDADARRACVTTVLQELDARGAELVMAVSSNERQRADLAAAGMRLMPRRLAPKRFYTVYRPSPRLSQKEAELLLNPDNWQQSFADWDTI